MPAKAPHSGLEAPSGDVNCSVNCSAQGVNCSASGVNCSGGPATEDRGQGGSLQGVRLSELFRGVLVPLVWAAPAAQAQANASGKLKGASGATLCGDGRRTPSWPPGRAPWPRSAPCGYCLFKGRWHENE
jgi:hypothetical protein